MNSFRLSGSVSGMTGQIMMGSVRPDLVGWQGKLGDVVRTTEEIKIDLWLGGGRFDPNKFSIPESV